jgi:hypothetical protein
MELLDKKMKKGYEETYTWVIRLLGKLEDFAESAKRMGVPLIAPDSGNIDFLGRTYRIAKNGVELEEQRIVWTPLGGERYEYNLKSVLGYYLLSEGTGEPCFDFCPLEHFSAGVFRDDGGADPLSKAYAEDYEGFRALAEQLGMEEAEHSPGRSGWNYRLLPKIPVKLVYYEGDDEFPTKIQVLYDKTAIQFFKFEPLAALHQCFVEGLRGIGKSRRP